MEGTHLVARSAKAFFSGTLVSRFSGMARDVITASLFGTSTSIATFMLAFRFSNLLRRLLAESPLASSFVPIFESLKANQEKASAVFFKNTFYSLTFVLGCVITVLEIMLSSISSYVIDPQWKEIINLTQVMLPSIAFITYFGLSSALLQCEKSYFIPSVAPVAFNFVWVVCVVFAYLYHKEAVGLILALGVVAAFLCQWLVTLPKVWGFLSSHLSLKELFKPFIGSSEVKAMGKPFVLGMMGVGATQINTALDSLFAKFASSEGPAYLWYAIRLQQVPLALFAVALSSAILPPLSRALREGLVEEYEKLTVYGLQKTISLMLASTLGLFIFGLSSVTVIFTRGAFDAHSALETTRCLYFYGIGLVFQGAILVLTPSFYACTDYHSPMRVATICVIANIILNSFCIWILKMGAASVALSTSLASAIQLALLWKAWKKQFPTVSFRHIIGGLKVTVFCLCLSAIFALATNYVLFQEPTLDYVLGRAFSIQPFSKAIFALASGVTVFLGCFIALGKIFKETHLLGFIRRSNLSNY